MRMRMYVYLACELYACVRMRVRKLLQPTNIHPPAAESSFAACMQIVEALGVQEKLPAHVMAHLARGTHEAPTHAETGFSHTRTQGLPASSRRILPAEADALSACQPC